MKRLQLTEQLRRMGDIEGSLGVDLCLCAL